MRKFKITLIAILAALILIVAFQNTAPVETRVLFLTITLPRAVLILITGIVGFALGVLVSLILTRKGRKPGSDRSP